MVLDVAPPAEVPDAEGRVVVVVVLVGPWGAAPFAGLGVKPLVGSDAGEHLRAVLGVGGVLFAALALEAFAVPFVEGAG